MSVMFASRFTVSSGNPCGGSESRDVSSGFPECVQDITLESVCDLTWSHCAFENVLGTLPQTFQSAIIESMHCILDGIMEQL